MIIFVVLVMFVSVMIEPCLASIVPKLKIEE